MQSLLLLLNHLYSYYFGFMNVCITVFLVSSMGESMKIVQKNMSYKENSKSSNIVKIKIREYPDRF